MYRRSLPVILGLLLIATSVPAQPPAGRTGPKAVGKGKKITPRRGLTEPTTRDLFRWLEEPLDMRDFQGPMSLKEVLGKFTEVFAGRGRQLPILVDVDAFREENEEAPDVYETPVKFPASPRRRKFGEALQFALSKIPTNNGTFLVRRGLIEVTTTERASPAVLLQSKVRPNFEKRPLAEVLQELADMTGATILMDPRLGEKARSPVTANFRSEISLEAAVKMLADLAGLHVRLCESELLFVTLSPKEGGRENKDLLRLRDRRLHLAVEDVSKWSGTTIVLDPWLVEVKGLCFVMPRLPTVSVTFRPGTSGKAAARILAAMVHLEAVPLDDAVYITEPSRAEQLRRELLMPQRAKAAPKK